MEHVRRILVLGLALAFLPAPAQDINKGYTFTVGERNVTHTKLNNLVDLATINPTFISGKTATTSPADADLLLLYSQGAADFRKVSLTTLLVANTNLIGDQTEFYAPATNDWLCVLNRAAGENRKIQVANLFTNWPTYFQKLTDLQTLALATNSTRFLVWDQSAAGGFGTNGVYGGMTFGTLATCLTTNSTLANGLGTNLVWASVPTNSVLTNNETLLAWDAASNRTVQLPSALVVTNAAVVAVLSNSLVTNLLYRSSTVPWTNSGTVITVAHGCSNTPSDLRPVVVCLTNQYGYAAGQEVAAQGLLSTPEPCPALVARADSTNVYLWITPRIWSASNQVWGPRLDDGNLGMFDHTYWNLKLYWRP